MMHALALFMWVVVTLVALGHGALIIRVRLPSGQLQRVSIEDEEKETIGSLRACMQSQGVALPANSTLTIKDVRYDCFDAEGKNATRLGALGLSPGEIVHVLDTAPKRAADPAAAVSTTASGAAAPAPKKKSASSIAEIQRLKKLLVKLARQKPTGHRVVAVAPSVGRILHRVAAGGVALLLGRSMTEGGGTASGSSARSTGSSSSAIRVSRPTGAAGAEGEGGSQRRECIEVHAACEIFQGPLPDDISLTSLVSLPLVVEIASGLGLSVVGCSIGVPAPGVKKTVPAVKGAAKGAAKGGATNDDEGPRLWTSGHVFAALQLRPLASGGRFVVLSAANAASDGAGKGAAASGKAAPRMLGAAASTAAEAGKPKKRRAGSVDSATRAATPGLTLEAFELSDQCIALADSGTLPRSRALCTLPQKPPAKDKTPSRNVAPSAAARPLVDPLPLNGPVLAQSTETTHVDPYLLAVPLPIVAIGTGSVAAKRLKGASATALPTLAPWRPPPLGVEFEHSFPSAGEMGQAAVGLKARAHVGQMLAALAGAGGDGRFTREGMTRRLRDVHLLLYLAGGLVERETLAALCGALGRGGALPPTVLMALDLTRQSLQAQQGGGEAEDEL